MNYGHFKMSITLWSWIVRVISLNGWNYLGKIFVTASSLCIFKFVWGTYAFRMLDCWTEENIIQILGRQSSIFMVVCLINFKCLLGVKPSPNSVFKKLRTLTLGEKKEEKKIFYRFFKNTKVSLEKFVGGNHYRGMLDFLCWFVHPHTSMFNSSCFVFIEWWVLKLLMNNWWNLVCRGVVYF